MCKTCSKCKVTYEIAEDSFHRKLGKFRSICKTCTKKYEELYRQGQSYKSKRYCRNSASKEYRREARKRASTATVENVKVRSRKFYSNNKDKCKDLVRKWKDLNKDKNKQYDREVSKRGVENMTDRYVKILISKSKELHVEKLTPEYIEAYRQLLSIKREKNNILKQIKTIQNG
jgi:hypothetical protein